MQLKLFLIEGVHKRTPSLFLKPMKISPIKNIIIIFITVFTAMGLSAQTEDANNPADKTSDEKSVIENIELDKTKEKAKSFNINALAAYGIYNFYNADFSITHNVKNFSYQLNADFKGSNDFGYINSGYYGANIGFTAMADFTESWKFIPEIQFNNTSRGMFLNKIYSREENDVLLIDLKNEYKATPSRFDINFGMAQYVHGLDSAIGSEKKSFLLFKPEIGWEYLWSASNKIKFDSKFYYYYYQNADISDDINWNSELIGSFKLFEVLKINLGPLFTWNKDAGPFVSGKVSLNTEGLKYSSFEISYSYDLLMFKPEEVYFKQKFSDLQFNLPPCAAHNANLKMEFDVKLKSNEKSYLERMKIKLSGSFVNTSNFYNYYSDPVSSLLKIDIMPVSKISAKGELSFDIKIVVPVLKIGFDYEYNYYLSDKFVAFKPANQAGALLKFESPWFDFEYKNIFYDTVYANPEGSLKLGWFVKGTVSFQLKLVESFYLYAKVDNIYNSYIRYRLEYPDPGVTFAGGLRVIL